MCYRICNIVTESVTHPFNRLEVSLLVEAPRARRRHRARHRLTRVPGRVVRRQRVGPDGLFAVRSGRLSSTCGLAMRKSRTPTLLVARLLQTIVQTVSFGSGRVGGRD